jgi:hypothetical protein
MDNSGGNKERRIQIDKKEGLCPKCSYNEGCNKNPNSRNRRNNNAK